MDTLLLNEQRCVCGKLLLKGLFIDGSLEIKCKNCGAINKIGISKLVEDDNHYVLIRNMDGNIVSASNSACTILGYTKDELIGKHYTIINPFINITNNNIVDLLNCDNYIKLETNHVKKNGEKISVINTCKLYSPSDSEKYIIISAELNNNNNNKNYNSNATCDLTFDIDKTAMIEYVDKSVEKYFGITQSSMVGKSYFDFVRKERKQQSIKAFKYFSSIEKTYRTTEPIPSGLPSNTIINELNFVPRHNDNGKFIGFRVSVWIDKKSIKKLPLNPVKFILLPISAAIAGSLVDVFLIL